MQSNHRYVYHCRRYLSSFSFLSFFFFSFFSFFFFFFLKEKREVPPDSQGLILGVDFATLDYVSFFFNRSQPAWLGGVEPSLHALPFLFRICRARMMFSVIGVFKPRLRVRQRRVPPGGRSCSSPPDGLNFFFNDPHGLTGASVVDIRRS